MKTILNFFKTISLLLFLTIAVIGGLSGASYKTGDLQTLINILSVSLVILLSMCFLYKAKLIYKEYSLFEIFSYYLIGDNFEITHVVETEMKIVLDTIYLHLYIEGKSVYRFLNNNEYHEKLELLLDGAYLNSYENFISEYTRIETFKKNEDSIYIKLELNNEQQPSN